RAGFSVVGDLPEAGGKVSMEMGIIRAEGWPHLVDRGEIAIEKRTGGGLRGIFAGLRIGRGVAGKQILQNGAQVGSNALGLRTAEDRLPGATTVGTGATVNVLPDLGRRLTHERIEPAI